MVLFPAKPKEVVSPTRRMRRVFPSARNVAALQDSWPCGVSIPWALRTSSMTSRSACKGSDQGHFCPNHPMGQGRLAKDMSRRLVTH